MHKPAIVVGGERIGGESVTLVGIAGVGLAGAPVLPAHAVLAGHEGGRALIDLGVFCGRGIPVLKGIRPRFDTCNESSYMRAIIVTAVINTQRRVRFLQFLFLGNSTPRTKILKPTRLV